MAKKPASKPARKPAPQKAGKKPGKKSASAAAGKSSGRSRRPAAAESPGLSRAATVTTAPSKVRKASESEAQKFAVEVARLLHDDHCTDIALLDIRGKSSLTDFIVIGSGTSDRQMHSVMQHVQELGAKLGHTAFRSDADDRSTWLISDFVDVVVHLFEPNTRAHYDLEMMWGDAKRPDWERPEQQTRNRAGLSAGDTL